MNDVGCLETCEAVVYAPNAVLGKSKDETLTKAASRLLKLNIRNMITLDGRVSLMAV
jgi:ABC-type histidine transport system ATPase subunit